MHDDTDERVPVYTFKDQGTVLSNILANIVTYVNSTVWNITFDSRPILSCDISLETS